MKIIQFFKAFHQSNLFCIFPKKKRKGDDVIHSPRTQSRPLGPKKKSIRAISTLFTMLSQNQMTEKTLGNLLDCQTQTFQPQSNSKSGGFTFLFFFIIFFICTINIMTMSPPPPPPPPCCCLTSF